MNEKQANISVFYSTPSCYLKSLHDAMITWPEKHRDFFPFSTDPHAYWTGFYTSRPTVKRFERVGNHFLQVCKQLSVLGRLHPKVQSYSENLDKLKSVMGVMQHHDALTGTEQQHVSNNYEKLLTEGIVACEENTKAALRKLTPHTNFQSCFNLNISACNITENMPEFTVTLFNPLSKPLRQIVRFPVHEGTYEVKDENGNIIESQIVPIPQAILDLPYRDSTALYELFFLTNISKINSVAVRRKSSKLKQKVQSSKPNGKFVVENSVSIGTNLKQSLGRFC